MLRRAPPPTPFPYTTLFRSGRELTGKPLPLGKHRGVVSYDPTELVISARAGTPLVELQACLRSEEHTSELQSRFDLVCRLLPEKKKLPRAEPAPADHEPLRA